MKTNKIIRLFLVSLLLATAGCHNNEANNTAPKNPSNLPLEKIKLPPGFQISVFASVNNARSLALGDNGTVFVGTRDDNKVYALVDANHDGIAEKTYVVASGLNTPNGVAFHNGALYIAEISKIWRIDNIESTLDHPAQPVLVRGDYPTSEHHGWKYIAFGPDGKLYVPVGAPCNICDSNEHAPRYASITRMNPDGSDFEIYAHGIRNTVGFDWQPGTNNLWFTDNGRDELGDNIPPDELNCATQKGMNFGYPYCHAGYIKDPIYGERHACSEFTPPVQKLGPHVAALGMKFYTGNMFPSEYKNQIFIAEHGSWNRSQPIGYRITCVKLDANNNAISYHVFADGWLQGNDAWGRPVSLLQLKDGSLLVSDDRANVVYRISYKNGQ